MCNSHYAKALLDGFDDPRQPRYPPWRGGVRVLVSCANPQSHFPEARLIDVAVADASCLRCQVASLNPNPL
jgi:hypothetical protein